MSGHVWSPAVKMSVCLKVPLDRRLRYHMEIRGQFTHFACPAVPRNDPGD